MKKLPKTIDNLLYKQYNRIWKQGIVEIYQFGLFKREISKYAEQGYDITTYKRLSEVYEK